ncbi:MAG: hypothetical protein Q4F11_06395 [Eubacteriales bacterium]|nr:hypothetical protein [Eubacteriales bacterium]
MKYCSKCGRQLNDGEVCNCQSGVQPQGQPMQGQFNGQPVMGGNVQFNNQPQGQPQGQFTGQPQGRPQYSQQSSPVFENIASLLKGLFKNPVSSVSYYVNNASAASSCIVIAVLAFLSGLRQLIYIAGYNIKYPASSAYEGVKIFTSFLNDMFIVIASAAVFALIIMLLVNAFEKDHKITYTQALAVASLMDIVYFPLAIVGTIIKMIPVAFFGYVASWIGAFGNGASYALVFIGIKSVERDDNHMPIVFGVALCAVAVMTTIVNLIF